MSEQNYFEENLPRLIDKLKSQVEKNMDIINREVETDIKEDKFFNVLKGRRMACEDSLDTMMQIDKLEATLKGDKTPESYKKEMLPKLIGRLKEMVELNLEVVDIEIDEEIEEDLRKVISDDVKEIFGSEIAKKILKKLSPSDKLTEDKFHNVLRARKTAGIDTEWALKKISQLENDMKENPETIEIQQSWAKKAAKIKRQ